MEESVARQTRALMTAGDHRGAHALALAALSDDAGDPAALCIMARIAIAHGNHGKGIELLQRATASVSAGAEPWARLAGQWVLIGDVPAALAAAEQAAAAPVEEPEMLTAIALAYSRAERHAEALPLFARAAAAQPADAASWLNVAMTAQFTGHIDAARDAYRRAIDCDPHATRAWFGLAQLERQRPDGELADALHSLWDAREDADDRLRIGHALAKCHEDGGDHKGAGQWLDRAKARSLARSRHDDAATDRLFAAASVPMPTPAPVMETPAERPLFVVGLPRSGTTLVERILTRHPDVASVGESPALSRAVKLAAGTRTAHVLDTETLQAARHADPAAIGASYRQWMSALAPGASRTLDKMPLNFLYAPIIARALPGARIVFVRRDPLDSILAVYRQMFAGGFAHYEFNLSIERATHFYIAWDRFVAAMRTMLPPGMMVEIAYEDVVRNTDRVVPDLLARCGLDWHPDCLSPHEGAGSVSTASSVQVREPIHDRSIGRWRHYADCLAPAIAMLERAGITPPPADLSPR